MWFPYEWSGLFEKFLDLIRWIILLVCLKIFPSSLLTMIGPIKLFFRFWIIDFIGLLIS